MKLVFQRVLSAGVRIGGEVVASIGPGALILLGVARNDTVTDARYLARKVSQLRVFDDADGRMNLPIGALPGRFLVVSQFTLCGDCTGGNRPGYTEAAPPETAQPLYEEFLAQLRALGHEVQTGRFGARMVVELANDGPVTLWLESRGRTQP